MDLKNFSYSDLVNMEKDLRELIEKSFWDFPKPYEINILDLYYHPDTNKIIIIDNILGIEEKELVFKDRKFFSSIPANYEKFFYPNSLNTKRHKEPTKAEAPDKIFINEDFLKDHFNIDKKSILKDLELIMELKQKLEYLRSEKVTRLIKNIFSKSEAEDIEQAIKEKEVSLDSKYYKRFYELKAKYGDTKHDYELHELIGNEFYPPKEGTAIKEGIKRHRNKLRQKKETKKHKKET